MKSDIRPAMITYTDHQEMIASRSLKELLPFIVNQMVKKTHSQKAKSKNTLWYMFKSVVRTTTLTYCKVAYQLFCIRYNTGEELGTTTPCSSFSASYKKTLYFSDVQFDQILYIFMYVFIQP